MNPTALRCATRARRTIGLALVASGLSLPFVALPAAAEGPTVNGGGSSFAKLEIDAWRGETARNPYKLSLNYVAQGSSFGRQQYIENRLDFAASDIPFEQQELGVLNSRGDRKDFVYVPVSAGGLGFMFNIKDTSGQQITDLNLTRNAVCRIFTEPNMKWSDPELAQVNPGLGLPDAFIRPVVREDGSGTSYVLSEFCLTVAPNVWGAFVNFVNSRQDLLSSTDTAFRNGQPSSRWPRGWGKDISALAADGVAAAVADPVTGENAITYNEAGFAKVRDFPNAWVQNQANNFTQPTEDAVSIALSYAEGRGNGTFSLNFTGDDANAYFPSTYSYVIAQTTGFDPAKGVVLAKFLCYAVTRGQRPELTNKLGYARLSQPLVDIARDSIAQIPGAPPWEQCKAADAPPPPTQPTVATTIPASTTTTRPGVTTTTRPGATTTTRPGATTTTRVGNSGNGGGTTTTLAGTSSRTTIAGSAGGATTTTTPPVDLDGDGIADAGGGDDGGVVIDDGSGEPVVLDPATGSPVGGGDPAPGGGAVIEVGQRSPVNAPQVDIEPKSGVDGQQVMWVLLQGAGLCGLGVAVAGKRRRA